MRVLYSLNYEEGYIDIKGYKANPEAAKNLTKNKISKPLNKFNKKKFEMHSEKSKKFEPNLRQPSSFPCETNDSIKPIDSNFQEPDNNRDEDIKTATSLVSNKARITMEITKEAYQPLYQPIPEYNILESTHDKKSNIKHIYIKQYAFDEIKNHIDWGQSTIRNKVEQGGLLLGWTFIDQEKKMTYGVIEKTVANTSTNSTKISLNMDHKSWQNMLENICQINTSEPTPLQVIGWYHTHPNELEVFMSNTDKKTQAKFFYYDWQFAIVLNPHKQKWCSYNGKYATECEGYIIS